MLDNLYLHTYSEVQVFKQHKHEQLTQLRCKLRLDLINQSYNSMQWQRLLNRIINFSI